MFSKSPIIDYTICGVLLVVVVQAALQNGSRGALLPPFIAAALLTIPLVWRRTGQEIRIFYVGAMLIGLVMLPTIATTVANVASSLPPEIVPNRVTKPFVNFAGIITGDPRYKTVDATADTRIYQYHKAAAMISEAPLFGHGLESVRYYLNTNYIHNIYLHLFAEGGFPIIISFTAMAVLPMFYCFKLMSNPKYAFAVTILITIVLSDLIHLQFSGSLLFAKKLFLMLGALVAIAIMYDRQNAARGASLAVGPPPAPKDTAAQAASPPGR